MTITRRIALILAPWAAIVLVWYAIHYSGVVNPALVPTPHDVAKRFFELSGQRLPQDVWISTQRVLLGVLFGILLALMGDAARLHALAARRAGASWEELSAVVSLAFLFRGLPAANLGAEIIQKMAADEGSAAKKA